MQLFKTSTMMIFATIFQSTVALTANACSIKCIKLRNRRIPACFNPCFTPGEYEYKVIQRHLNNPCSEQAAYWRKKIIAAGLSVPPFQRCKQAKSRPQRSTAAECITAGLLRLMDPMERCRVVKLQGHCPNIYGLMTPAELTHLVRDSQLNCLVWIENFDSLPNLYRKSRNKLYHATCKTIISCKAITYIYNLQLCSSSSIISLFCLRLYTNCNIN